jgi:release factor glutamine methyltransferase
MPREARLYEETITLDGGDDGLDIQRRAILEAPLWLAPGAHLLVETSDIQAESTMRLMKDVGLAVTLATSAEWGATVVIGRLSA